MKKTISLLLALLMLLLAPLSLAEEVAAAGDGEQTEDTEWTFDISKYTPFVIGATTRLNGAFFTNMWGNNTCDIDVRSVIHGYSPVVWTMQSRFEIDPQVVQDVTVGELDDGGKLFMVTLWNDLTYNDGTIIKAKDYVFSLMLFANPVIRELGGITTNTDYIVGFDEYYNGETNVFSGIRLIDDYTFMVEVKAEYLPFFFEISYLDCIPYPIDVIAPGCEIADDGAGCYIRNIDQTIAEPLWNAENLTETILDPDTGYLSHPYKTSGPWMLTSFDWDTREATFDLNPYYKGYYDGQRPTIDHLLFKSVLPETMFEEYRNGEVHLLNKVVAQDNIWEGVEMTQAGESDMKNYLRMGLGFLTFACEEGPGQFESVRKAIAYSLDRTEFKEEYIGPFGEVVNGYYGIGQWMVQMISGTYQDDLMAVGEEDATEAEAEANVEAWNALLEVGLDFMEEYTKDLDKAKNALVSDGWVLNESGAPFTEGVDTVRYRQMDDGSLMGLIIKWGKMQDSWAADMLEERLVEPLAELGIALEITEVAFVDLLQHYYRQVDRTYDMMYLATNFISVFDPYFVFNTADEYQGPQNTTGYRDQTLEDLAWNLRKTEEGALLEYCQKWVLFQQYYNEKIPMLPIYSNIYFDFHTLDLWGYYPDSDMNWPVALLYATLGAPSEELMAQLEAEAAAAEGDGESAEGTVTIPD